MEHIFFTKMSGAGNDFIILDKKLNPKFKPESMKIRELCSRRTGIGADGLIIISDSDHLDFVMNYYNSDGSEGALCGNGARCAIKYGQISSRVVNGRTKFESYAGSYSGELLDDGSVKFNLNNPTEIKLNFDLLLDDQNLRVSFINTGAPHVVIKVNDLLHVEKNLAGISDIDSLPVFQLGRKIRYHDGFGKGTNVNFIKIENDMIYIRTYERGVEEETLACGTGSVAAALISFLNGEIKPPASLKTRSGDILIVNFDYSDEGFTNVSLTGPAKVIFTGEITI